MFLLAVFARSLLWQWLNTNDVHQIEERRQIVKPFFRRLRQPNGRRTMSHHQQLGMKDVVSLSIGHHEPERLEGLFLSFVAEIVGAHSSPPKSKLILPLPQAVVIPPAPRPSADTRSPPAE
jgi:hypothetical protein